MKIGSKTLLASVGTTLLLLLTGCSHGPGGETTCAQWHTYDDGDIFTLSDEQEAIVKRTLEAHDKSTLPSNISIAATQIAAYCGTDGYPQAETADKSIESGMNFD